MNHGLSYRRSDFPGRTKAEHAQAIEALSLEAFDRTVRDNDDRLFETLLTNGWGLDEISTSESVNELVAAALIASDDGKIERRHHHRLESRMTIKYKIEKTLILIPEEPPSQKQLRELVANLEKDEATKNVDDLAIEWRWEVQDDPNNREWQQWARHYDTLAWQVASIFTAASAILAGGYINARVNHLDVRVLAVLALAGVGLVLFQMFIVGAFRTYRYELYKHQKEKLKNEGAVNIFRTFTGLPWIVYCFTAAVSMVPWVFALSQLGGDFEMVAWFAPYTGRMTRYTRALPADPL